MITVWLSPWAWIIAFQVITASASIGRIGTSNYLVSRACNSLALSAVAADFAVKYFMTGRADSLTSGIVFTHRADDLTGLLVFSLLAVRPLAILGVGSLDRSLPMRRITCAVTFAVCVACTIAAQNIGVYAFRLVALPPAIGIGFGCLGEASNDTAVRRRCILALGCILAVFAFEASAWGLLFKNLLSDAGVSVYNMLRYRDPPPWARFSRGQSAFHAARRSMPTAPVTPSMSAVAPSSQPSDPSANSPSGCDTSATALLQQIDQRRDRELGRQRLDRKNDWSSSNHLLS